MTSERASFSFHILKTEKLEKLKNYNFISFNFISFRLAYGSRFFNALFPTFKELFISIIAAIPPINSNKVKKNDENSDFKSLHHNFILCTFILLNNKNNNKIIKKGVLLMIIL